MKAWWIICWGQAKPIQYNRQLKFFIRLFTCSCQICTWLRSFFDLFGFSAIPDKDNTFDIHPCTHHWLQFSLMAPIHLEFHSLSKYPDCCIDLEDRNLQKRQYQNCLLKGQSNIGYLVLWICTNRSQDQAFHSSVFPFYSKVHTINWGETSISNIINKPVFPANLE